MSESAIERPLASFLRLTSTTNCPFRIFSVERNHLLDHARRLEYAAAIIRTAVRREDQSVYTWWGLTPPTGISLSEWNTGERDTGAVDVPVTTVKP